MSVTVTAEVASSDPLHSNIERSPFMTIVVSRSRCDPRCPGGLSLRGSRPAGPNNATLGKAIIESITSTVTMVNYATIVPWQP